MVHRGNPNPNRPSGLHGKSARGDGSPLSRLSAADPSAPKARHQKRGNPVRISPFLVREMRLEPAVRGGPASRLWSATGAPFTTARSSSSYARKNHSPSKDELWFLVREMRLELTRRLTHAPQTCLSTYSSTLANLRRCCVCIERPVHPVAAPHLRQGVL